ncbi:MAG: Uma2 family endonuclease [Betaproteobacteria bacterium]|nr:Uma2 family endonuclease [Betaproteobacteria bacterium]
MGSFDKIAARLDALELIARWAEAVGDPALAKLPYKFEMDRWGNLVMTPPANVRHSDVQGSLMIALQTALGGRARAEFPVITAAGVLVPDVVWCSPEYVARNQAAFSGDMAAAPEAPELCVEVKSPSNSLGELKHKVDAYLAAGALEGWVVLEDLAVRIFGGKGEQDASGFAFDIAEWRSHFRP